MSELRQRWQQYKERLEQLSVRERVILFVTVAAIIWLLMQTVLIDPLLKQQAAIKAETRQLRVQIESQRNERALIEAQITAGVNRDKERRRDELIAQQEALDKRIADSVVTMIPPQLMTEVLEQVLSEDEGLRLLALENLPVDVLIEQSETEQADANLPKLGLYKHRFVLTLQGDFQNTVEYFQRLNKLPWRFHWDALSYEVNDFPKAVIRLQVYTVSRSEEWIGV